MKISSLFFACAMALLLPLVSSWGLPSSIRNRAAAAMISAALVAAPLTVEAIDFTGDYADPKHPNCLRQVQVLDGKKATVSGTDGTPGCPPDGSGRAWSLAGSVNKDTILVDFSPKGGPANLLGKWEPEPVPGIR
mmetsp:Transcript_4056/g.6379  ORF Transcript_4056/g.6379 Transcript_4056/m.6379 type:complete len:135 (-) Transcript_4056:14-418(-)